VRARDIDGDRGETAHTKEEVNMARKYGRRGRRHFGAPPMNIDAPLAPGVGAATALIAASLARYYGKAGGFVVKHSGAVGAGAGILASVVYGIARGMGAGIASGVSAVAVGGGFELMQAVHVGEFGSHHAASGWHGGPRVRAGADARRLRRPARLPAVGRVESDGRAEDGNRGSGGLGTPASL